jgi:SAM-dependent MidA family methyltransferase
MSYSVSEAGSDTFAEKAGVRAGSSDLAYEANFTDYEWLLNSHTLPYVRTIRQKEFITSRYAQVGLFSSVSRYSSGDRSRKGALWQSFVRMDY